MILRGFVRDCGNCERLKDQRRASNSRKTAACWAATYLVFACVPVAAKARGQLRVNSWYGARPPETDIRGVWKRPDTLTINPMFGVPLNLSIASATNESRTFAGIGRERRFDGGVCTENSDSHVVVMQPTEEYL